MSLQLVDQTAATEKNAPTTNYAASSSDVENKLPVNALDALANVNSIFTGVVFVGLTLNVSGASLVQDSGEAGCVASARVAMALVVFEVLAFALYMMSSLIVQGLKLHLCLRCTRNDVTTDLVPIKEEFMRRGILASAITTLLGTVCLTLSIVAVIEIRLGLLTCTTSPWSRVAAIPLIVCISLGGLVFFATVMLPLLCPHCNYACLTPRRKQ